MSVTRGSVKTALVIGAVVAGVGGAAVTGAGAASPVVGAGIKSSPVVAAGSKPGVLRLDSANQEFAVMDDRERVGQLFMAALQSGQPPSSADSLVSRYHVGSFILQGHWNGAYPVQQATYHLKSISTGATAGTLPYLAGDQEGGQIQPFKGSGFTTMPSALQQGTHTEAWEQYAAHYWALQLHAAGLNLDLAPIGDTVPSAAAAAHNPPIGQLDREFSYSVLTNNSHVAAFVTGMQTTGVATAVKHFPGLGRVSGNTDVVPRVVDSVTTSSDSYLQPFEVGKQRGSRMIMASLAYYSKIDPNHQAAFSGTVINNLLRGKLGYSGVVISDSMGAASAQSLSPADQAVSVLQAGGDVILQTDDARIPEMESAVLSRMSVDSSFRATVYRSVQRVLHAKAADNLLPAGAHNPVGSLDSAIPTSAGRVTVSGWAADPDSASAVLRVSAYVDGRLRVTGTTGAPRPDVAYLRGTGPDAGYHFPLAVASGSHTVCTKAVNIGAGSADPLLGCRTVSVR